MGGGILERKHIFVDGITYIGKETDNLENNGILDSPKYSICLDEEKLKEKILKLSLREAKILGLNPETLRQIKKRIIENKVLFLRKKTLIKIY